MLDKSTLFLVAQPDVYLSRPLERRKQVQYRSRVTDLVSGEATPSVVYGLRGSQLAQFTYHGVLETGKKFEDFTGGRVLR